MRKFNAMLKKEYLEMFKNYKIITIPIIFMILGALQPITYYYMPDILKMATLPDGAILQIPLPTPFETMVGVFGQFTQMGLLILVLVSMGSVANEVKNGVYETIFVKPVPVRYYILSKWIAYFSLTIIGTFVGAFMGQFYTIQLIGDISLSLVLESTMIYTLFLLFIMSITLLLSSIFKSGIVAGGITIAFSIGIGVISQLPFVNWWLPSHLLQLNKNVLLGLPSEDFSLGIISTIFYIILSFILSVVLFKRKSDVSA